MPPRFAIDTAGLPLYTVELASAPRLMAVVVDRTRDNYFHGGDAHSVFATGPCWCVPPAAWARLCRLAVFYYRVIVLDHSSGTAWPSVDDQHLDALPSVVVESIGHLAAVVTARHAGRIPPTRTGD